MPTDTSFNDDDSALARILTAAVHLMPHGLVLALLTQTLYFLGIEHWSITTANYISTALILLGLWHYTASRMCVRCMREAPADAGGRAQREKLVLWMFHRMAGWRAWPAITAFVTAAILVQEFGFPRWIQLPPAVVNTAIMYSMWLHHRLRPWCPYCRDWDNGDGLTEPSPDPVVKATH